MEEYGPSLTMGKMFSLDKERIRKALEGYLIDGEDENGFTYRKATKAECDRFILQKFDNAVYHCLEETAFCRVYSNILESRGIHVDLHEILVNKAREDNRFQDYEYEPFDNEKPEKKENPEYPKETPE